MENYFNYFKKSLPQTVEPPSRTQSYPSYSSERQINQGSLDDWTNYPGTSNSNYTDDLQQLCLPTGSIARQRRQQRDIVERFSAMSLNDNDDYFTEDDDQDFRDYRREKQRTRIVPVMPQVNHNANAAWYFRTNSAPANPVPHSSNTTYKSDSSWFCRENVGQVPQIHHNIFQTRVTTNQITARSLARVVSLKDSNDSSRSSTPEVIHLKNPFELEQNKRGPKWYFGLLFWTLGILCLVGLLNSPDNHGSICWNKEGAGLLMVTVAANVSEWDGIWKASFTVRSDNNLTLYILLIGAVVGFIRHIFDK